MGIKDWFRKKKKGRDFGYIVYFKNKKKIPFSKRRELIGQHINNCLNQFYETSGVQYYSDEKRKYLLGVRIVGFKAMFPEEEFDNLLREIGYRIVKFLLDIKVGVDERYGGFYTPKEMKEEVLEMADDFIKDNKIKKVKKRKKK